MLMIMKVPAWIEFDLHLISEITWRLTFMATDRVRLAKQVEALLLSVVA